MARKPSVWFRAEDQWFYTTINKKQIKLSQDKDEAERLFHQKMADALSHKPVGPDPTFRAVADLFLTNSEKKNAKLTFEWHKSFLQSFCNHVKQTKVSQLKRHMIERWIEKWEVTSTQRAAIQCVVACLNWAKDQEYIQDHPYKGLKRPPQRHRERIFTPEEKRLIMGAVKDLAFRNFLFALDQTGARPFSEIAQVTASDVNFAEGTIKLWKHKNERKTGKPRIIYLNPPMIDLVKLLCMQYPEGPLWRNKNGDRWRKGAASYRMRLLEEKLKLPDLTVYAYRHTYITTCLSKGLSASIVAELCGNSTATIDKYYNHLSQRRDILQAAARQATQCDAASPAPSSSAPDNPERAAG